MAVREQAFKPSAADTAVKAATGRDRAVRCQFSITVSKTMQADVSTHCKAVTNARPRKKWSPPGMLKTSSQTRGKCLGDAWKGGARQVFGFASSGDGNSQSAVHMNKRCGRDAVEAEHVLWKRAFNKLETVLED